MPNSLGVMPSFSTGYAEFPGASEYPDLWVGLDGAYSASLGSQGGICKDLTGKGNDGTFQNQMHWNAGRWELDGTTDYADLGNTFRYTSEDFTVLAKIMPREQAFAVIVGNGRYNQYGWRLEISGGVNNTVAFHSTQSGAEQDILAAVDWYEAQELFTLCHVREGTSGKLFKNGVEPTSYVNQAPLTDPGNYSVSTKIGAKFDGTGADLYGHIYDIYIWKRALKDHEVKLVSDILMENRA